MSSSRSFPCILCAKRTKPAERRSLNGDNNKHIQKYIRKYFMVNIQENDVICGKCRRRHYTHQSSQQPPIPKTCSSQEQSSEPSSIASPRNITLPLSSIGGSHSTCFVCKRRGPKMINVTSNVRFLCFVQHNLIIPAGARCCPIHVSDDAFTCVALDLIQNSNLRQSTDFNRTDILNLLGKVRAALLKSESKRLNFDSSMSDPDIKNLTGINNASFDDLATYLSSVRDTQVRSTRTSLGLYLTKLKTGLSNKILSTLFNISKDSVRRTIKSVRKNLVQTFTPSNIGFQHVSRNDVINHHTRPLAQTLFGQGLFPAILILDGTYIYIQKSSYFRFQRRSFSLHKHRPLIKPMVIVTSSGYFVSILGPYLSDFKNNDANIIKHAFATDAEEVKSWVQDGDVFVVDRGFRDSVDFLNDLGIKSEMPAFLDKGQKQLSTEQSNTSRLVTKIRWVVESANARLKSWKFFDKVLPNSLIPYVHDDLNIIGSICNKYLPPLSSGSSDEDQLIGCKMLHLATLNNELHSRIETDGLDKIMTNNWEKLDSSHLHFPSMTEDDIRSLAIGVYQVNLAKSYAKEHLNDKSEFEVLLHKQCDNLICAKLQSRHVSSRSYLLWIEFDEVTVQSWYCKCRTGCRVVGMCAHIASVIWYLGYARHLSQPFCHLNDWTQYLKDAKDMPEPESIDDSEDSDDGQIEE